MKAASLTIEHITKRFGGIVALNDISFEVKPREIHGIIGPNGAGKTTMFNIITGIYPPTEGNLTMNGESLLGVTPHTAAQRGIARTFQNIRLFSNLTAYDNLVTSCSKHIGYSILDGLFRTKKYRQQEKEIKEKVERALEYIGLTDIKDQMAGNLPYGQQRRLEIARALVTDPILLLLDEPAAGMNEDESARLSQIIRKISTDNDLTTIVIDHHMDVIMDVCEQITVFNFGSKLAEGTPREIQSNPQVKEAYLGVDD